MPTTEYDQLFSFFGLRENPFNVSPDPRFFFSTPAQDSALAELLFAIRTRHGLSVLSGEAGAGKTTLIHRLLEALGQQGVSSAYVFHSRLDAEELFEFILRDFGIACASRRKGDVLQVLHQWLIERNTAGDTPVIIIDEAQALPASTLDELRLLLNLESSKGKLVQILLAGQPELDEKLRRPELRQLRQRVMFRCRLPLLSREETGAYIQSRLASAGLAEAGLFPEDTIAAIYTHSKGIPRTVNLLGEHALINAYAEHKNIISPEDILYIAADFDLVDNPLSLRKSVPSPDAGRVMHFPSVSPDPGSLSALRMAFCSAEPDPVEPPPVGITARTGPALVVEQTISLAEAALPTVPPQEEISIPEPPVAIAQQPAVPAEPQRNWRRERSGFRFANYWNEVSISFQRDVRAFCSDCADFFRGRISSGSRAKQINPSGIRQ